MNSFIKNKSYKLQIPILILIILSLAQCDQVCKVEKCAECQEGQTNICQQCETNWYLSIPNQNTCIENCPVGNGYYKDGNNCKKCDIDHCKKCSESGKCDECFYSYNGKCVKECPNNTNQNNNGVCINANFKCPNGQYQVEGKEECKECYKKCMTCNGAGQQSCLTCGSSQGKQLALQEGECVSECSSGYTKALRTCVKKDEIDVGEIVLYTAIGLIAILAIAVMVYIYRKKKVEKYNEQASLIRSEYRNTNTHSKLTNRSNMSSAFNPSFQNPSQRISTKNENDI